MAGNKISAGLPDKLKSGIENLSGMDMGDVKVHYNSPKPAQMRAHAFAQGNEIHLGPGQDHHLPHEAWHVVQQKQGRISPTTRSHIGLSNDDEALKKERELLAKRTPL